MRVVIPGLREAVECERRVRVTSFLDLPRKLCGVPVRQMTLMDLVRLDAIQSPFVCGGTVSVDDIANFLWLLSPEFSANRLAHRWFYLRNLRRLDYESTVKAISGFIDDAMQDVTPAGLASKAYCSFAAHIVGLLASQYGWSESDILNLPLKRSLQYRNEILLRNDRNAVLFNPSDRLTGRYLNSQR